MYSLGELTNDLESSARGCPDWDLLDNVLGMLLASPSLPEKTLDACRSTCSQLISRDGQLSPAVNPQTIHRLFNVLVNIANLMHRIDSTIPATTECYVHAIELVIQSPQSYRSASKLTIHDFALSAWTIGLALSFVRESRVPPHIAHALKCGGHVGILTRVGNPDFDIVQAVHDAGDGLLQALVDPATGSLPNLILFPEQIHHLPAFLFSSRKGVPPGILASHPTNSAHDQYPLNIKTATTSVLLCLARRYQSAQTTSLQGDYAKPYFTTDGIVLLLHYIAASLCPNASVFNDIGVILCGLGPGETATGPQGQLMNGRDIARLYYERGLQVDSTHPHLLSNLGSLLKDAGHTSHAIGIFNRALMVHPDLDIALVNMGNTLKDSGQLSEAIPYYLRAISVNPDFTDAYCGLSHSMNAVCQWSERGDTQNVWMQKAIEICEKQLSDANSQTVGFLRTKSLEEWMSLVRAACGRPLSPHEEEEWIRRFQLFDSDDTSDSHDEGSFLIRTIEWCITRMQHAWYIKVYGHSVRSDGAQPSLSRSHRPTLPTSGLLSSMKYPRLPFILPFHTFTLPLTSRTIRLIAHRNAINAFFTATTYTGRTAVIYPPPPPPLHGTLNIGYVSSDFNDHPLSHLMKSVFGLHNSQSFNVFLYATSPSDGSPHRQYYERQTAFQFLDVSLWSNSTIVEKIVQDQIHILVNLGGYTKGARNEIFAARPCPVQISLMGFAGWCDYLVCDPIACPTDLFASLSARSKSSLSMASGDTCRDIGVPVNEGCDPASPSTNWIYTECPIYMPHTFFVTDHKQSYRQDEQDQLHTLATPSQLWATELRRREEARRSLFPDLPKDVVIFANFNQLIFWTWLRILYRVPRSILWLLRFPAAGEANLLQTATAWAGPEVASRIRFTDVAPKEAHIFRCRIADLVLDTVECCAHTVATDVLWSGTPLIAGAWPNHRHKMSSRVAASVAYATGLGKHMVVHSREEYEDRAVTLANSLKCPPSVPTSPLKGQKDVGSEWSQDGGELLELRRRLFLTRKSMPLFDTARWTRNLEKGYIAAWTRWVEGRQFGLGGKEDGCIRVDDNEGDFESFL
ncbi:glycosyltransferase family 41 protein [Scleroderma citrinum Foug A]|uniref:protein O-GlcNAc transferase n=1 Tax=Scleroderma citrinum Foug A TaxID=1036808 RepID=A0A0C3A113_9AGAM|nr:glycosyltransferase family 41 protein [Scleroderma citrinum Foug A]